MTPSPGTDLAQYRTQAKELLKQARIADTEALDRIRRHHPEHEALLASGRLQLADTQLALARELDHPSWAELKQHLFFLKAVRTLDAGDLPALTAILDQHPSLTHYQCRIGEYERGYFAGATLLHHIAGNPARCPIPTNILDIARLLLARGSTQDAATDTIGLLLTSRQASEAAVAVSLIELLHQAGGKFDMDDPGLLSEPIWNGGRATAEELVRRGAKMDIRHAAALGRLDILGDMLAANGDPALVEEALVFACVQGEEEAVHVLVRHGAKGDVIASPSGQATALHNAAWRGYRDIVQFLLDNGASATLTDNQWHLTPAGWADHGGHPELAALLRERE